MTGRGAGTSGRRVPATFRESSAPGPAACSTARRSRAPGEKKTGWRTGQARAPDVAGDHTSKAPAIAVIGPPPGARRGRLQMGHDNGAAAGGTVKAGLTREWSGPV